MSFFSGLRSVSVLRPASSAFSRSCARALPVARSFATSQPMLTSAKAELPDFIPASKNTFNFTKVAPADLEPLKLAHALYATVHIYDRKFLVTEGDEIVLPVRLRNATVGDTLNFDKVSVIGSRDHTLTGMPLIDPSHFKIKGVVVEKSREKKRVNERTQRRIRHIRHVPVENCMTVIRINELSLK
ncbi:similar to Saccharomyces cerevisiae YJL096W MRPL49 Mitochondrial ribosomal protein of the large subunit [Geotrichum candidum]|uniref:Large ribosomal subunit protein bL21m n=2 Tax=Geotrichum candidum TaxID=1173061 RepID=A0A0J9X834_GEOCN|nr:similar to Saccharomyces cerevisiae YJL096W MRPL49 Mitochondrial ribosomal protein of the large subunit [Geotrichum candidum]